MEDRAPTTEYLLWNEEDIDDTSATSWLVSITWPEDKASLLETLETPERRAERALNKFINLSRAVAKAVATSGSLILC